MANVVGGSFKAISPEDIKTSKSVLNQLVDVIQEDVSGSSTRRAYQVFVTGGIGPGVTSSLFQTVYDQDFTLQTSNPMFDMTVGLYSGSSTVSDAKTGELSGKMLFPSESLMMREKVDIYRQYASTLLGDADQAFFAPFSISATPATTATNRINEAIFFSFKRLFTRDGIKKETFAVRMYASASSAIKDEDAALGGDGQTNLAKTSISGSSIFTDIGASTNQTNTFGGGVATIKNAADTNESVGLIFYDAGTIVLDANKIFSGSQQMSGTISAMEAESSVYGETIPAGQALMGSEVGNPDASLIPDFFVSASIDNIINHIASTRLQSGSLTAATFQNNTNINSTLIFCRATADEFNYSTNPTFVDATTGRIKVIDSGQDDVQRTFTMPTTVGLHDQFGNLLAVAKVSRPIEKNDEKDITFRVRLDF
tara:strand:+ start:4814 stop:6091 length:1278 start_codon:yes stop_codon:yes gene_type:complete